MNGDIYSNRGELLASQISLAPLWSLANSAGGKIGAAEFRELGVVAHYAIDELAVTGLPRMQDASEIASDKLLVGLGDLLVSRLNPRRGHVFEVSNHDVPAVASTEFAVLRPSGRNDSRFVRYAVASDFARQHLDSHVRSSTKSHGRVEFNYLWNQLLPSPSLEAQTRIADYLDQEIGRINAVEAAFGRRRQLLWERFWSHVDKLTWPDDAVSVGLGAIIESAVDGPFGSSLSSKHYVDHGPRVVRLGNVARAEFLDDDRAHITPEHYSTLSTHAVHAGDLVVAGLGDAKSATPAGRACLVPDDLPPAIVKADCFRLRFVGGVVPRFVAWQLSSPSGLQATGALARGSTRARLNLGLLRQIRLRLPPAGVQRSVAQELEDSRVVARRLDSAMEVEASLLRERRQALITAAVTGELEV